MTKKEKIIESWGEELETYKPNEDGWSSKIIYDWNNFEFKTFDTKLVGHGMYKVRPESLNGIENNNGWIKIESKLDLPIERGYYFVIMNGKKSIMGYAPEYQKWIGGGHYYFEPHGNLNLTHYQPINFPSDNVY